MNSPGRILWVLVCVCCFFIFAKTGHAQSTPLAIANNYFVTGDYVVGGVGLRGLGDSTGLASGKITIPDPIQPNATAVPAGADIVAAFLYWETVESSNAGAITGMNGFFNGYPISGAQRGNPNAPTSWSTGGCSGSAQGSKTMRVYRADVRPYLNVDANGNPVGNGTYMVQLPDSGSNGGGVPLTLGASLVIVYRVQSPQFPLTSVVLYDGTLAPSNSASAMNLPIVGFYDAAASATAKLTHIVGNGQPNKLENVSLGNASLLSLYGTLPPFPGVYNQNTSSLSGGGSWDNPTWLVNTYNTPAVNDGDATVTAQVAPSGSNSGCVNWGAVVFSTPVKNSDGDGILDSWKRDQGYIDVASVKADGITPANYWVALPGAKSGQKDLFVELDYLSNLDGKAGAYLHSHLPKEKAINMVGDALCDRDSNTNTCKKIQVHFDLGSTVYQANSYVVDYSKIKPLAGSTAYPGAGGNVISEGALVCPDGTLTCNTPKSAFICNGGAPCAFPSVVTTGWKGDVEFTQSSTVLGNFQLGRKDSYHYVLFGHALGSPRTYWSATGGNGLATLSSITVQDGIGTVVINTPAFLVRPGDPECTEASCDRVVVEGALRPANATLNGVFQIIAGSVSPAPGTNLAASTTTFQIQATNVADGIYSFANEPQLGLSYGGPTSDSGFSDIGGGDSTVTFGLWVADDASGCQANPASAPNGTQVYCTNQVGTITAQAGTLLHELGHTFFLTHGGTYFPGGVVGNNDVAGRPAGQLINDPKSLSALTGYGLNCNPAYESSMNYLFQIRGFPDGGIDYSGQTLQNLTEGTLDEGVGLGSDLFSGANATHFTRWYATPNALDKQFQTSLGSTTIPGFRCDGSPNTGNTNLIRVDGTLFPGLSQSANIDWNHNLTFDLGSEFSQDINFNGSTTDAAFKGFNDWVNIDLRQIGARADAFGFSGGGTRVGGGGTRVGGGGTRVGGGGSRVGGGGTRVGGGGTEQDTNTANSTADAPVGLTAVMKGKAVQLNWFAPEFGQVRAYSIWRTVGFYGSFAEAITNKATFTNIVAITTPTPPSTSYLDSTVKNNTPYTYFVVDKNVKGAQSGPSATARIQVKF
jgi:hypothetical protein